MRRCERNQFTWAQLVNDNWFGIWVPSWRNDGMQRGKGDWRGGGVTKGTGSTWPKTTLQSLMTFMLILKRRRRRYNDISTRAASWTYMCRLLVGTLRLRSAPLGSCAFDGSGHDSCTTVLCTLGASCVSCGTVLNVVSCPRVCLANNRQGAGCDAMVMQSVTGSTEYRFAVEIWVRTLM